MTRELPATERRNPASARLDEMGTEEILRLINAEGRTVPSALPVAAMVGTPTTAAELLS